MKLTLPIYRALHCRDETPPHCQTCRADRAWRRSLVEHYGGPVDYECPLAIPWPPGFTPSAETVSTPPSRPARTERAKAEPLTPEQQATRVEAARAAAAAREEAERAALPGAWERVRKGVVGLTKYALGIDRSPADLIAARLAVCDGCPNSLPKDKAVADRFCDKSGDGRPHCGCWLKAKTAITSERCPADLW